MRGHTSKSKKKAKIKGSSYTPGTCAQPTLENSAAVARTLQKTKLKSVGRGGFKLCSSRGVSGVAVPNVLANDPRSTEDILDGWYAGAENYGWDEAYVKSFMEKDMRPPDRDPEEPVTANGAGKGDTVLQDWTKEIDTYLRIIITLEGRGRNPPSQCQGRYSTACSSSDNNPPTYRCLGCDNGGLMCSECMRVSHKEHPFHRIQKWNGEFFERSSLKEIGVRIQLGHPPGEECCIPEKAWNDDFVVLDCDAVHSVGVDYCHCGFSGKTQVEQLLERRLYPATIVNPKTACTFRALEFFEMLQYESKITPYEFYNTISRLTDNTGLRPVKDRYPSLLRMVHQWRHTRMLKRSGRGHDPSGAHGTQEGECALLCPPCPHPGINMAVGWENERKVRKFIHSLNIGLDANYRLKRKDVSSEEADPGLSKGYAYFVNNRPFLEHVERHADDKEPKSTCSRHDAVNLADIRPGQGYAATGVATVECTRHNMKRPSAVCDLQKGERYSNMDYITACSLVVFGLTLLRSFLISYDIVCQWSIHLLARLAVINQNVPILKPEVETRFVVPKFHLPAHIPACQTQFAFMFTPGAGLGDGEAPERGWAETNPLGPSTREMGPGTRRDTLDYHFGDYNWGKITALGPSLLKKMDVAVSGVAERIIAHKDFEDGLKAEDLAKFREEVTRWEASPSTVPNPFDFTIAAPSQTAIRKALAEEDKVASDTAKNFSLHAGLTASELICKGLDLESEMRSLKGDMKETWDHSRDRQLTRIQLKSNAIVRKVDGWYRYLQLYIPSSILLRQDHIASSKTVKAYELPLWLPSQIGRRAEFPRDLARIEFRLRTGQAQDALSTIRRNLQRRVTVWDLKDRWLRGQGANTRALNLLSTLQKKIQDAKEEYNQARVALLSLAPILGEKDVEKVFLKLEDSHLKPLSADSVTAPSQGQTRQVEKSWIWNHPGAANDNVTKYEAETRKIEWAKTRARSHRYQEEVLIVEEEMQRTLRFFQWKEDQWRLRAPVMELDARQNGTAPPSSEHAEGLRAYSERQASIWKGMRLSCLKKWAKVGSMIATAKEEVNNPKLIFERRTKERARIFSKPLNLPSSASRKPASPC
ncbi:hypothetical protein NMY22_g14191 [Coprinellus aureogranulatus]|nr:hypothetical protein NMY22_g14191 [Coprinellus aureogranulatus]